MTGQLDPSIIQPLADQLCADAGRLNQEAGGVNRNVPPAPQDSFGLGGSHGLIAKLDIARESFHHRIAGLLDGAGEQAILQVIETTRVDRLPFQHLPTSAL